MHALIFDLDGTLVDTVYAHVFAWQRALAERDMSVDAWRIHRRIGMSGGLFARALGRELGRELTDQETESIQDRHGELYREMLPDPLPLPGARELLADLRERGVPHGIATSGRRPEIDASLDVLGARRARALGIGVLTGGYGEEELLQAGAYRVYRDAAELHGTLDELGLG